LIADLKHIIGVRSIFHSDANFILVKFIRAQELFDFLISQKISISIYYILLELLANQMLLKTLFFQRELISMRR